MKMKQIIPFHKEILFKTMIGEITSIALDHTLAFTTSDTIEGDFIVSGTYKMTEASQIEEDFSYPISVDVAIDDKYDTKNAKIAIDDFYYEIINDEILKVNIDLLIDGLEEHQIILAHDMKELSKDVPDEVESIEKIEDEIITIDDFKEETEEFREVKDEKIDDDLLREETDLFKQTGDNPIKMEVKPIDEINLPTEEEVEVLPLNNEIHQEMEKPIPVTPLVEKVIETTKNDEPSTINSIFETLNDDLETFATYSVYIVREGDTIDSILEKYKVTREDLAEYNNLEEVTLGSKLVIPTISNHESV